MKKLLLCLSALFLSVSFATAQTSFEISPSNGDIDAGAKSCEWNYTTDSNPAGLKIVATDANGSRVNAISVTTGTPRLKFSAGGAFEGSETVSSAPTTFTVSVNENYLITGYSMIYTASSANRVTISDDYGYNKKPSSRTEPQTMEKLEISLQSIRFYVSAEASPASLAAQVNSFTIYVQKVGGEAPVEYTVSATASPAEGGAVTVNGAAEATTTGKVELEAVPAYGYKFKNWTVGTEEVATTAEYTATVSSNTEFVAVFEKLTDTNDWYASIQKPTFTQLGNTTFVKAATLAGDVNAEVTGIQGGKIAENQVDQKCVTNVIEVAAGAEFDLNITYQLNWGDLAIYQLDNNGATKEYGYYFGSWEPNGSTAKVVQYLEDGGITVSEIVDGACTATFPISINENHTPGDVIVVRAITGVKNNATNSAYEQGISEGGYVDFLFVVTEEVAPKSYTLAVGESGYATLFLDFNATIPENVDAYIVTEVNKDYVTLIEVTGVLPANTGIIVNASADNYDFVASTETPANVTGNLLEGTVSDEYIQGEAYVLGIPEGETEVALCKAKLNGTSSWLNNANRAYLPADVVPSSAALSTNLRFDFGGTTAIEEVETEAAETVIYDLTGRRVNEITKAGVYIVNGRKVLVK